MASPRRRDPGDKIWCEDYFQFDYLEHERDVLRQTLEELP